VTDGVDISRDEYLARLAYHKAQGAVTALEGVQRLVDKQAEDEGLWFVAVTAPEAYLQQDLRMLHGLVESDLNSARAHLAEAKAKCKEGG